MTSKVCKCGRGHVSAYDGKCGHCRSTKEQKTHIRKRVYDDLGSKISEDTAKALKEIDDNMRQAMLRGDFIVD
jgi:isopentenyldiphosphate isomerase